MVLIGSYTIDYKNKTALFTDAICIGLLVQYHCARDNKHTNKHTKIYYIYYNILFVNPDGFIILVINVEIETFNFGEYL